MSAERGRNLRLVPGGLYGRKKRRLVKVSGFRSELLLLDNRKHLSYLRIADRDGDVPSEGIQNVREGKTHPWRVEGRRYLEMKAAGVPVEDAVTVAMDTVYWLINDVYQVAKLLPHDPNGRVALMRQARAA